MAKTKRVTSKKKKSKKTNVIMDFIKTKRILISIIAIVLILLITSITLICVNKDKVVITIDNIEYKETDFNMYAYLVKYDYFGIDGTKLSESTLNTLVSNESELTVGEYLKEKTISKIKISAAILQIAKENKVTLDDDDIEEIEEEKEVFIEKLGGKKEFKKLLKDNNTNEKTYMEVAKVNKLYSKVFDKLYAEGKRFDITDEDLHKYEESYKNDYVKIKQIILLKKDLNTNEYLDDKILNQKKLLANSIVTKAKEGNSFSELIESYSEGSTEESEYYLKSELIDELKDAVNNLAIGSISEVISTDNAYHIILKEELDDKKLDAYLDSKREKTLVEDISKKLDTLAIINSKYLDEVKVS